ncbi:MAG TPA: helix-turn-helix domain-containing protein [Propionibacteriaceae bacterium]|nr:helix-turn-helix domain-containing protein [Propionibacteriaceae bacterium]
MLGNTYEDQNCSAARALELVGERWSLLIVRDALFGGITRFADFQRSLGLARNILSSRLDRLVAAGLMERRQPEGSPYHEYHLTEKGEDLKPVVIALSHWGDRWAAPYGPPILYRHARCGGEVEQQLVCRDCGKIVDNKHVGAHPGPGMTVAS